jgi:hypothetical protein
VLVALITVSNSSVYLSQARHFHLKIDFLRHVDLLIKLAEALSKFRSLACTDKNVHDERAERSDRSEGR